MNAAKRSEIDRSDDNVFVFFSEPPSPLGDVGTRLMGVSTEFVRRFVRLSQSLLIPSITFLNLLRLGAKQVNSNRLSSGRKRVKIVRLHRLNFILFCSPLL